MVREREREREKERERERVNEREREREREREKQIERDKLREVKNLYFEKVVKGRENEKNSVIGMRMVE